MIVRPLSALDAAAWRDMMLDATAQHPSAFLLSHDEIAAMDADQTAARLARGRLLGLLDGAELVGFAGLNLWDLDRLRHRADIGPFYVQPGRRGSGAADVLMEDLVQRAKSAGVLWLDLWVAASNGRARAFYARHGFAFVAQREDAVRIDGVSEDDVLMTRKIAP